MKQGVGILIASLMGAHVVAQTVAPPTIQWSRAFAGDDEDRVAALERMPDGGYVLGCTSGSGISGDKTAPGYGGPDYWVIRLDVSGRKVWETSIGGIGAEGLRSAKPTPNGEVILVGVSDSAPSGNKTAPVLGGIDLWVVLLDSEANKIWDKSLGGTLQDAVGAVECTGDGGFLIAGMSRSRSLTNYWDAFLLKLDGAGEELWKRNVGPGALTDLRQTTDGGFVLAGELDRDFWIVRTDAEGNNLWDRRFGGSDYDGECRVRVLNDGGLILAGVTRSDVGGNKSTPLQGDYDYWVLRLDADGDKLWEHDLGGTRVDYFSDVHVTLDDGFIVAGFSSSEADGNKTAPRRVSGYDLWLVRLDRAGNRIWDETYDGIRRFGTAPLARSQIQPSSDGGLMIGASFATYTNVPIQDVIVLKLSADALTAPRLRIPALSPASDIFRFQLLGISNRTYVTEFSSDLQNWIPFATNQLSSSSMEIPDVSAGSARRFYRAQMVE